MANSYSKAVFDGDPALKVVLEFNGSVFRPEGIPSLVSTAGLTSEVVVHHRDGRQVKVLAANLQRVAGGQDGEGFVAAFFTEQPEPATLESMPDPEIEALKLELGTCQAQLAKAESEATKLEARLRKVEGALENLGKELATLKSAAKAEPKAQPASKEEPPKGV